MVKYKDATTRNDGTFFYAAVMRVSDFSFHPRGFGPSQPQIFSESLIVTDNSVQLGTSNFRVVRFMRNNGTNPRELGKFPTVSRMKNVSGVQTVDELTSVVQKKFAKYLKPFESLTEKQVEEIRELRRYYGPNPVHRYIPTDDDVRKFHAREQKLIIDFLSNPDKYLRLAQ